jgi:hypothetical protein
MHSGAKVISLLGELALELVFKRVPTFSNTCP